MTPADRSNTSPAPAASAAAPALRALVVEDNPINQRVITALLKRLGYEVATADDGQIGADKFRAGPTPSVVLMDLQMPVMDGYDSTLLMRAWEQQQGLPRTPIIAVTANAFEEFRVRAFEVGMDEFLTKPVVPQLLADTLARFVKP
ncbi:MAG: response regulator [Burkholderiaceae bacterium]